VKDIAHSWIEELQKAVTPMAAGSDRARAVAKDFANAERLARQQWSEYDDKLTKNFTPSS
jgi:glycine cleavage system aminomethyltransferase T